MTKRTSPLDQANDYFSLVDAAPLPQPFVLTQLLNDAHTLATGARAVTKLAGNSSLIGCDDEGEILTPATLEGLLGLVGLASSQFLISLETAMQGATRG